MKSVLLDDIMAHPEAPEKAMVIDFETRSLRDARHLLASNRIPDAMQFIEDNSHPVCGRAVCVWVGGYGVLYCATGVWVCLCACVLVGGGRVGYLCAHVLACICVLCV